MFVPLFPSDRGEVINGGFGCLLDGSKVSAFKICACANLSGWQAFILLRGLNLPFDGQDVPYAFVSQDADERLTSLLSWDVNNGVSNKNIFLRTYMS